MKAALVTGAGSGIGKATAIALSEDGWQVVLTGRRSDALEETSRQCPNETLVVVSDVTDAESVNQLFQKCQQALGRLDLLFNNAGINVAESPLEELSVSDWQRVIDTNITGSFLCTQEAFKIMKSQQPRGGRIINNGSISAHVPRPMAVAYTVSKHAITGLTRSSSLEGRNFDIACGQIDIGNASTEMTGRMATGVLQPDGEKRVEPTMNVDDVGKAIVYMANLPLDTNVPFMTVMANGMPYMGRG